MAYDAGGRLTRRERPTGQFWTIPTTPRATALNLASSTDARANTTTWTYDAAGNPTESDWV